MVAANQSGAATARASRQARTDSPANSSRVRSRTAASTWVESVRCLPPARSSPRSTNAATNRSRAFSSNPFPRTRVRNSDNTDASNPASVRSNPSAYFQSNRSRTASAACTSVRPSAICNAVTSANRPGDQPGRPRTPNAAANSASANNSPNSSRITTGNGNSRPAYVLDTASATASTGCGHGRGCTDITHPTTAGNDKHRPQPRHSPHTRSQNMRPE
jgi:hypothetical protein